MSDLPHQTGYTPAQRSRILALARASIADYLGVDLDAEPVSPDEAFLHEPRGCFVTLRNAGELRGCIGSFHASDPLHESVTRLAAAAARDPRFEREPVTADELDLLHIEVSILTPMRPLKDPLTLRLGVDGILIRRRAGDREITGCFLPCVAVEQGWDVPTTLAMCCEHKMRLPPDAWRKLADLEFFAFEAIEIG